MQVDISERVTPGTLFNLNVEDAYKFYREAGYVALQNELYPADRPKTLTAARLVTHTQRSCVSCVVSLHF